ncbi:MAG: hypothetical protein IJ626_02835 [Muribaculaceae bacterium]|nr:hypothetical protein [Muribaculaceae bacterium]
MENKNQYYELSEQEMLELWKREHHLEETRGDCLMEREDGIDLDEWLTLQMREWYGRLLETAPVEWLPVEDVTNSVRMSVDGEGVVTASVPAHCVRPVEWQLEGWKNSVTHFAESGSMEAEVQRSVWTRGAKEHPAVVDCGNTLILYSLGTGERAVLKKARCVVRPEDGTYKFHYAALRTIREFPLS